MTPGGDGGAASLVLKYPEVEVLQVTRRELLADVGGIAVRMAI